MSAPAVEVQRLCKVYGSGHTEVVAIRDALLTITRGEIVGMLDVFDRIVDVEDGMIHERTPSQPVKAS